MIRGIDAVFDRGSNLAAIEVWLIDCERASPLLESEEARCSRLSKEEVSRGDALGAARDRLTWRASHIALRLLIERWAGAQLNCAPFARTAGGRPELSAPAPSFSLSHSGGLALVALSSVGPIGADIEAVAVRAMSEDRRARLEEYAIRIARGVPLPADREKRLIQAWTRIEALAKADGRGVGETLTAAGLVGAATSNAPSARIAESTHSFTVCDVKAGPAHAAAVASPLRPFPRVETSDFCAHLGLAAAP